MDYRATRFTKPQSILLDLARGLAAQLVLIGHAMSAEGLQNPKLLYQNLGVATFFILSGLLVTHSVLSKPKDYGFTDYLIERGARIFVPYVPAVAFIVICSVARTGGPTDPFTVIANLFMLEDYPLFRYVSWFPEIDRVGNGRPLWSVAVEWWFYMAAASLYFARRLPAWSWVLIVPGLFVMFFNASVGALGMVWIAGAVIAMLFFKLPRLHPTADALLFSAFALTAAYRLVLVQGNFYDLELSLLLALTLVFGLKLVEGWNWLNRLEKPIAGLAAYSYTIYLTHYTVMSAVTFSHGITRVLAVIIAANLVALVMYWLFERHYRTVASALKSLKTRYSVRHQERSGEVRDSHPLHDMDMRS